MALTQNDETVLLRFELDLLVARAYLGRRLAYEGNISPDNDLFLTWIDVSANFALVEQARKTQDVKILTLAVAKCG